MYVEEQAFGNRQWFRPASERQETVNPSFAKYAPSAFLQAISAGLGVALVPEQLKKLPHKNVAFRPITPAVATEACVAWKGENPSAPLKAYVEIVEHVGRSLR